LLDECPVIAGGLRTHQLDDRHALRQDVRYKVVQCGFANTVTLFFLAAHAPQFSEDISVPSTRYRSSTPFADTQTISKKA
jgi:hypothetical protein